MHAAPLIKKFCGTWIKRIAREVGVEGSAKRKIAAYMDEQTDALEPCGRLAPVHIEDAPKARVSEFIASLFEILNNDAMSQWIKWVDGGKAFHISDPRGFHENVSRIYWRQSSFRSFYRQLHIYGFTRIHEDVAAGEYKYFHESFQQVCASREYCGARAEVVSCVVSRWLCVAPYATYAAPCGAGSAHVAHPPVTSHVRALALTHVRGGCLLTLVRKAAHSVPSHDGVKCTLLRCCMCTHTVEA